MANIDTLTTTVDFKTDTNPLKDARKEVNQFEKSTKEATESVKNLGLKMVGIGAAFAGFAAAASAAYAGLQKEIQLTVGLVGLSQKEADKMGDKALDMSAKYGIAAKTITQAGFTLASAGQRGETLFASLDAATRGAAAGLGDVSEVAIGVAKSMEVWGDSGLTAQKSIEGMIEAAKVGLLDASELAGVYARIGSTVKSIGVSFEETSGILAHMSLAMGSVSEAGTAFSQLAVEMKKPRARLKELMTEFGLGVDEVKEAVESGGFHQFLMHLHQLSGVSEEAFSAFFGSKEAGAAVLELLGDKAENATTTIAKLSDSSGELDSAWKAVQDTLSSNFQELTKSITGLLIEIGKEIGPFVSGLLKMGTAFAGFANSVFEKLPFLKTFVALITGLGIAVGAVGVALLGLGFIADKVFISKMARSAGNVKKVVMLLWAKVTAQKADTVAMNAGTTAAIRQTFGLNKLGGALKKATAWAIRLRPAMQALFSVGVLLAISLAIAGIQSLISHFRRAKDEAKEQLDEMQQETKQRRSSDLLVHRYAESQGLIDEDQALTTQQIVEIKGSEAYLNFLRAGLDLEMQVTSQQKEQLELLEKQKEEIDDQILHGKRDASGRRRSIVQESTESLETQSKELGNAIEQIANDVNDKYERELTSVANNIQRLTGRVIEEAANEEIGEWIVKIDNLQKGISELDQTLNDLKYTHKQLEEAQKSSEDLRLARLGINHLQTQIHANKLLLDLEKRRNDFQLESINQQIIDTIRLEDAQRNLQRAMRPLSDLDNEIDALNRQTGFYQRIKNLKLDIAAIQAPLTELEQENSYLAYKLSLLTKIRQAEQQEVNFQTALQDPEIKGEAFLGLYNLDFLENDHSLFEDISEKAQQITEDANQDIEESFKQRAFLRINDYDDAVYQMEQFQERVKQIAERAMSMFVGVIKGDTSFAQAFEDLGTMALEALARKLARDHIAGIVTNALGGAKDAIGRAGGSFIGSVTGGAGAAAKTAVGSQIGGAGGIGAMIMGGQVPGLAAGGAGAAAGGAGSAIGGAGLLGALGGPVGLGIMGALTIGGLLLGGRRRRRARERAARERQRRQMEAMIQAVKDDCEEKPWLGERIHNRTLGHELSESLRASSSASTAALNTMAQNASSALQSNASLNTAVQALTNPASMQYQRLHLGGPGQSSISHNRRDTNIHKVEIKIDGAKDAKKIAEDVHRALSTHEWENAGNVFYSSQRL